MRLIDDWLFITTDLPKAIQFYDMVSKGDRDPVCVLLVLNMWTGHPEYGCFISKDKSLTNFDHPELVNIVDPRSRSQLSYLLVPALC